MDLKSGKRVRQMPIGTVVPLSSTPAVLISLRIAAMASSPVRYRNRSKHQVPGRGTDDWQRMRFCNLPGGATLARAYPETTLARAYPDNAYAGLPEQRLHGPAANNAYADYRSSAFVGRVRRQPPPDGSQRNR